MQHTFLTLALEMGDQLHALTQLPVPTEQEAAGPQCQHEMPLLSGIKPRFIGYLANSLVTVPTTLSCLQDDDDDDLARN
jgi:hypothetical protein